VNDRPVGKNGVVSAYKGEVVLHAAPEEESAVSNAPAARSAGASAATC